MSPSKGALMDTHVIHRRGWPSGVEWVPPKPQMEPALRLGHRLGLILHIARDPTKEGPSPSVGAFLLTMGRSLLWGGVIVPDAVARGTSRSFQRWARCHPLETLQGPAPWQVVPLSTFFHPYRGTFTRANYGGAGWCIGTDLGLSLGLAAEHWYPRAEPHRDTWVLWLPGWGRPHDRGRWKRVSPHRPCLFLSRRRVGWWVSFGPLEKEHGKQVGGRPWRGAFIDLLSLAYALDGDRGASYGEHRVNFGLKSVALPVAAETTVEGVRVVTGHVLDLHEFARVLDGHAHQWFPERSGR